MEKEPALILRERNIYTSVSTSEKSKYDGRAKYYEELVSTNWFNMLHWNTQPKHYTQFASEAILRKAGSLIDIGCGGLSHTASLYQASNINCTLVDLSVGMLKVAESRLTSEGNSFPANIRLIQSDAFNLPFAKGSFDTLCSFGTLHLFNDKATFVKTILQVLKPGGDFYFLAMTNKYVNSRIFMNVLRVFGEFGNVCSGSELRALFPANRFDIESTMKGSVLFIKGKKIIGL